MSTAHTGFMPARALFHFTQQRGVADVAGRKRKLTDKQELFVNAYLKHFNATRAAAEAGYSEDTAYSQGSRLLKNVEIASRVQARLKEAAMSADEVLFHLREIAVGLRDDVTDSDGKLDPLKVKEAGQTHLIKSFKQKTYTTEDSDSFESELDGYDRLRALELIGKHLKMWTDKVQVDDWRSDAIQLIRAGEVSFEPMAEEFGHDLATELFRTAGVPVVSTGAASTGES